MSREQAKPRHEAVIRGRLGPVPGRPAWLQLGPFGLPPPMLFGSLVMVSRVETVTHSPEIGTLESRGDLEAEMLC